MFSYKQVCDAITAGGLFFAYQPQYYLDGNELRGYEALLRLRIENQVATPDCFLDVFEQEFLRAYWPPLFRGAVEYLNTLHESGLTITLSLNVSPEQLLSPWFLSCVKDELVRLVVPAGHLEFELTEHTAVDCYPLLQRKLEELRKEGVRVAIDDFGAGYAGLHYLASLKVDTVKIDRYFVEHVSDPVCRLIIDMVVKASEHGGYQVVAEGIETQRDAETLALMGCHIGQGYYFGRPAIALNSD